MIRLAENLEVLSAPYVSSPFGCQIRSKAQAYGFDKPFAQFWTDGEAAYGKTDGSVCIAGEITDAYEARAFLSAVGTNEVVCSAENAEKLGLNITESGAILQKVLRNETVHPVEEISPREIYVKIWNDLPLGSENTVAVHIRHLREKLEINPAEPRYLKVVWGQGYKCEKQG